MRAFRGCLAASCASLVVVIASLGVFSAAQAPPPPLPPTTFEATWSASGHRETIAVDGSKTAVAVELSGPVVLSTGGGLSRGFTGTALGFDDGEGLTVVRAVWTDAHGDRLFSRLRGESVATGRRFAATITGGTGRYAGATGEYSFTWQFIVEAEDGAIQGRTVGLSGRVVRGGTGR